MCVKKLIKNSQPFGKNFQKTVGEIFLKFGIVVRTETSLD